MPHFAIDHPAIRIQSLVGRQRWRTSTTLAVLFGLGVPVGGLLQQEIVFQKQVKQYLGNLDIKAFCFGISFGSVSTSKGKLETSPYLSPFLMTSLP